MPRRGKPSYDELIEENKRLREEIVKEKKRARRRDKYKDVKKVDPDEPKEETCDVCGNNNLTSLSFNFPNYKLVVITCGDCGNKESVRINKDGKISD